MDIILLIDHRKGRSYPLFSRQILSLKNWEALILPFLVTLQESLKFLKILYSWYSIPLPSNVYTCRHFSIINFFISTSNISSEPFLYLLIVSQRKLVFTMITNNFGWTQYILIMICFLVLWTLRLSFSDDKKLSESVNMYTLGVRGRFPKKQISHFIHIYPLSNHFSCHFFHSCYKVMMALSGILWLLTLVIGLLAHEMWIMYRDMVSSEHNAGYWGYCGAGPGFDSLGAATCERAPRS